MGLLFLAIFNSILGLSVLFPVLGPLGRSLGLSEVEIGLVSTSYALTQFVFAPFWGRLSERRGRKPILLVGIVGYALGFLGFGVAAELGVRGVLSHGALLVALVAARLLGGALSSATLPTAQAWAADLSERRDRAAAMGVIGAAFGLAVVFGPAIGAGCAHVFGLLSPIVLSVVLAMANAVLVAALLREPARKQHAPDARPLGSVTPGSVTPGSVTLGSVMLGPVALRMPALLAVGFAATLSSVAMEQTIAFAFEDRLGLSHEETPTWVGLGLVSYGVVAVLMQGLVVRRFAIPPRTLVLLGLPFALVGMGLLAVVSSFPMLVVALTLQGLGQGLILPGVTSALSLGVGEHEQGAIAGVHAGAQGLARLCGPLVGAQLYSVSGALPYEVSSGLLAAVLVFVLLSRDLARSRSAEISARESTA